MRFVVAGIAALSVIWFFATAEYGSYPTGIYYMVRPPFVTVIFGPAHSFMVPAGVNAVRDRGEGLPGNVLEFPVGGGKRVGLRLFSVHWVREEFNGWASDHPKIAGWLGHHGDENCPKPTKDTRA